jgi:hypothetical protein
MIVPQAEIMDDYAAALIADAGVRQPLARSLRESFAGEGRLRVLLEN